VGGAVESHYVNKSFKELNRLAVINQIKADEQTISCEDTTLLQKTWIKKKKTLHAVIPHNEIKEIELWISEAVKCVKEGKFSDASIKLEVVAELTEQVPKNFKFTFENIL
jgi:hypothetical protein